MLVVMTEDSILNGQFQGDANLSKRFVVRTPMNLRDDTLFFGD